MLKLNENGKNDDKKKEKRKCVFNAKHIFTASNFFGEGGGIKP